jgi:hypothetical protein
VDASTKIVRRPLMLSIAWVHQIHAAEGVNGSTMVLVLCVVCCLEKGENVEGVVCVAYVVGFTVNLKIIMLNSVPPTLGGPVGPLPLLFLIRRGTQKLKSGKREENSHARFLCMLLFVPFPKKLRFLP